MTTENNAVVGYYGSVKIYNTAGSELFATPSHGDLIVAFPYQIAVCQNNGEIAVCDLDESAYGGKNKPHVTVFDAEFKLKYQYFGHHESQHSLDYTPDFNPYDVVFDADGRLLVAADSFLNRGIELLSDEGRFLTVIYTDRQTPKAFTLLQDGKMFVGFQDKTMKLIEYRL